MLGERVATISNEKLTQGRRDGAMYVGIFIHSHISVSLSVCLTKNDGFSSCIVLLESCSCQQGNSLCFLIKHH